jgi:hypothetical protein
MNDDIGLFTKQQRDEYSEFADTWTVLRALGDRASEVAITTGMPADDRAEGAP